ncbi:MAG: ATP-binding protein [Parabacteroides sp.]|nr:ATP-binding protein [Parabacteroides sp.]MDD7061583.1 ATP-binding protein [bacterium]MDY4758323.1 ATP-binding protein [Parabacteroides sp.]
MGTLAEEIKELEGRVKLTERLINAGWCIMALSFIFLGRNDLGSLTLICTVSLLIYKAILKRKLSIKEDLAKEVEERTEQIRSEKDAIQEESDKLAAALSALSEAQDELVRKERMATVGQLTQGLVDRILNPLNYINNFANLSEGLAKELRENLESQKGKLPQDVYEDSEELLDMMSSNLQKISAHGYNTVRIVKAMEALLKDRVGVLILTNMNTLCRIALEKLKKSYEKEIQEKNVRIVFDNLNLSLMMEVNADKLGKAIDGVLKNAMYAVLRKAEQVAYSPEIYLGLKVNGDQLDITIRDNGTGIDEKIKDKIFAPFFTTKTTGEAAGVGLYLCREIVQNHRGRIEVESQKGEYTQFLISLPIYSFKQHKQPEPEEAEEEEQTHG